MQIRKDILLFYLLILCSAGVIIAAEQPVANVQAPKKGLKCCENPRTARPALPLNTFTEGMLRFRA